MNAIITNKEENHKFTEWSTLIEFLNLCEDKNASYQLLISIHTAQKTWQYSFDSDIKSILQYVYTLKDINYKVDKIWDDHLDSLPGD